MDIAYWLTGDFVQMPLQSRIGPELVAYPML
jgi:hypothetical protein